jgi:putative phosphoesterase
MHEMTANITLKHNPAMLRVGLISDTHGLLRQEAVDFLRGSDFIVHAGDICEPGILEELRALAPVTAVRGNNDRGAWAERLHEVEFLQVGDVLLYAIHDLSQLNIDLTASGVDVVVSGHSHKPLVERRNGFLYVNPGSSGPRRFKLPDLRRRTHRRRRLRVCQNYRILGSDCRLTHPSRGTPPG